MIKSYLLAASNALWRQKGFAITTVFSIAISLVVVICVASLWNMISAPLAPEVNKERTFYIAKSFYKKSNGQRVFYPESKGIVPKSFYSDVIPSLEKVELCSYFTNGETMNDFIRDGRGKTYHFRLTDANFFKIFDFEFVNGEAYDKNMTEDKRNYIVVSEAFAKYYFGKPTCRGELVWTGNRAYTIAGVFKQSSHTTPIYSEVYIGTPNKQLINRMDRDGTQTTLLCSSEQDFSVVSKEIAGIGEKYGLQHDKLNVDLDLLTSVERSFAGKYGYNSIINLPNISLLILILFLPIVSLFEILKSNMSLRKEEIGIRKAFGATNWTVAKQLVFENVLIINLGGLLGMVFALLFFTLFSGKNMLNLVSVFFDWRALINYVLVFILMGIISGLIPTIQLSKIHIIKAINHK